MLRILITTIALSVCAAPALAQNSDEPTPAKKSDEPAGAKKSDEPSGGTKSDEPGAKKNDEPSGSKDDEPSGGKGDEPAGSGSATPAQDEPGATGRDEPGADSGDPAKSDQEKEAEKDAKAPSAQYGIGFQGRMHVISPWMLKAIFEHSNQLVSGAFGIEFIRRNADRDFDIIASVDFGFWGPKNGNYLEKGDDPATQTDYIQFDSFNFITVGVHFIKHHKILPWMSFIWGGGVGLAIRTGSYFRASTDRTQCTPENFRDETACHPIGMDPRNPTAWLNDPANQGTEEEDSPTNPKRFKAAFPPVIPMAHLLVGFNFPITDFLSVRVDGGFRNAFYMGSGLHYFF